MSAFVQNELPSLTIDYFRRMLDDEVRPDEHIFPSATKACEVLSRCDIGQSVHSFAVKTGYDGDVFVGSSMVDMYTQMGEDEEAFRRFKQALAEDLDVTDFTFCSVVRVCGNSTLLELGKQIHGLCLK